MSGSHERHAHDCAQVSGRFSLLGYWGEEVVCVGKIFKAFPQDVCSAFFVFILFS